MAYLCCVALILASTSLVNQIAARRSNESTPKTDIVVVEGNYLLMRAAPWNAMYDITVSITPSIEILEQRLLERWLEHGFNEQKAREKIQMNDLPNARAVLSLSVPANCMLS